MKVQYWPITFINRNFFTIKDLNLSKETKLTFLVNFKFDIYIIYKYFCQE